MTIIGLYSGRGTGKDTLFRALNGADSRCRRYAFADPLKQDLAPFIYRHFNLVLDRLTPEQKENLRHLFIGYGMAQRAFDPDHWLRKTGEAMERDLAPFHPDYWLPVLTDVRFPNEADWFRRYPGFHLIGLRREGAPAPTDEEQKHVTEMEKRVDIWVDLPNVADERELVPVARDLLNRLSS